MHRSFRDEVALRWSSPTSPLARAARAAGRFLERAGIDLERVALMPKGGRDVAASVWVVECRETHLRELIVSLGRANIGSGLFILRPGRKQPLRALRLAVPDPSALPFEDLEGWVAERAPHIRRIG